VTGRRGSQFRPWPAAAVTLLLLVALAGGCSERPPAPPPVSTAASIAQPEAVATKTQGSSYPTQWLGPRNLTVAPGVHVLAGLYPSAVFAIETDQGVILIDAGVEEGAFELREYLLQVGLKIEDVRLVLITHAHYDHVFGVHKVREVSGAIVAAGRDDCDVLRSADQDSLFSLFSRHQFSGTPIPVDRQLQDGDVVELGNTKIQVLGTPGHTPGSVSFVLERDGQRILFSGDTIASLNFGPASYPARLAPRYRGDAQAFLDTIRRFLAMQPPDLLLTSHPRQQTRMQSIRLDEQSWRELLTPAAEELEKVIVRHQLDGKDFLDGTSREIETDLCYLGDLEGVAVYAMMDGERLVVVNAPGGNGFAEFVTDKLASLGWPVLRPDVVLLTSAQESHHSGLRSLSSSVHVVAPPALLVTLRASGAQALSHESLAEVLTQTMQVIATDDRLCYQFKIDSRQVVITPDVPRLITLVWTDRLHGRKTFSSLQPQTNELRNELSKSPEFLESTQRMLKELGSVAPHIWLPAIPSIGQNANLYDEDWSTVIEENLAQIRKVSAVLRRGP
jgi:metallo-beta-lactamase class B